MALNVGHNFIERNKEAHLIRAHDTESLVSHADVELVGIGDHLQSLGVERVVHAAEAVTKSVCHVEVAVGVHFRFLSVPFLMY